MGRGVEVMLGGVRSGDSGRVGSSQVGWGGDVVLGWVVLARIGWRRIWLRVFSITCPEFYWYGGPVAELPTAPHPYRGKICKAG